MGRRTVLAALLIFTVSGCAVLGGGSSEDEVLEMLKASAQADGSTMPASIECEESDALDYVESLNKARTCNVTGVDGSSSMICVLEQEGMGGAWGLGPESCEDMAAGGWGRVTP